MTHGANNTVCFSILLTAFALADVEVIGADVVPVPNSGFEQGDQSPEHWRLEGNGRWVERSWLEVTGSGSDSSFWRSDDLSFRPRRLYQFRTLARRTSGSGTAITGPAFANRDQSKLTRNWQWIGHVFRTPDNVDGGYLRLGQWHATGSIQFDAVQIVPVVPVHRQFGPLTLGEGESIQDGEYTFAGTFSHRGSNYHRTLDSATASFNSDRWVFGGGSQVTYRFALPGHEFQAGTVQANVNYHVRGSCQVEASGDGRTWHRLAVQEGLGTAVAELPGELLPARELLVRVHPSEKTGHFQVNRVDFRARLRASGQNKYTQFGDIAPAGVKGTVPFSLRKASAKIGTVPDRRCAIPVRLPSGTAADAVGETLYAEVEQSSDKLSFASMAIRRDSTTGDDMLRLGVRNTDAQAQQLTLNLQDPLLSEPSGTVETVQADEVGFFDAVLSAGKSGEREVRFQVVAADGSASVAKLTISVPDFYRADYGQRIEGITGDTAVWWCDATHKVPRRRALPEATSPAVQLEPARHDHEAVQIIVRPTEPLGGLVASAGSLVGPGGAKIPADSIRILQVYYHFVHHPTDQSGIREWWHDALPPLDEPIDVAAGQNQPLWVLVHVPPDAEPGDYAGRVSLSAKGFSAQIPLRLHVWDFALPKRNHLETNYGFSVHNVFRYHGLKTEADKRKVLDLYQQSFAEHRISPYDPTPLDPIRVKFLSDQDPPRAEVDFSAFDRAMERAVEQYGFTGYRLPIQGMGGGTFHRRYPPKIAAFDEETPEYQAMFSSYVGQLEKHLREKGWLDMAYVYWFDEPAPRDYEFVAGGMRRLKQYAPGLRRMLTEEPADNVLAGSVDVWCPISSNYDHDEAEKRRVHGERFWWYVCTGPKAPYCTLFIDHPATELRIWHWQTWQRKIVGTLVWQSNYWTSSAAFPDEPQNPYEDPMGYVSGYSTPRGVRRYWGNGDGRFIYPPLAAAVPGKSGSEPVIAPPVSSIRWEMIREGVEDYEYLYLLRELVEKNRSQLSAEEARRYEALLEVPAAITTDMTTFATNPTPIYGHRRAVAEAIEALGERKE